MNATSLAAAIRAKADDILVQDNLTSEARDNGELLRVLARVIEGKSLHKSFGSPGDWGYGTPIGDALAECGIAPTHLATPGMLTLDTPSQVFFYEQDFYVLSNFAAFNLKWAGLVFQTSEAAYQWEKFHDVNQGQQIKRWILNARSAHDAFKCAEEFRDARRADWDAVKVDIMLEILRAKAQQHEYVRRKLLATGDRELIEHSWRDVFWGWGPNRDGKNMLGKLWMQIRAELRTAVSK